MRAIAKGIDLPWRFRSPRSSYRLISAMRGQAFGIRHISVFVNLEALDSAFQGSPRHTEDPRRAITAPTRPMLFCKAASISSFSRIISDEERSPDSDDSTGAEPASSHSFSMRAVSSSHKITALEYVLTIPGCSPASRSGSADPARLRRYISRSCRSCRHSARSGVLPERECRRCVPAVPAYESGKRLR